MDTLGFETACGSVIGTAHLRAGRNGQDGWAIERDEQDRIVMVVTDGCGSAPHSEVGAKMGARIVAREVLTRADQPIDWSETASAITRQLGTFAPLLDLDAYLLFTIVGAVITAEETTIFHAGDGLFAVNGQTQTIGPYEGNAPPYLGYAVGGMRPPELTVALRTPTAEVQSILIATDGADPLAVAGDFTDLLQVSRNPDALRRRLFLMTRPGMARLEDDTTIAMARRLG